MAALEFKYTIYIDMRDLIDYGTRINKCRNAVHLTYTQIQFGTTPLSADPWCHEYELTKLVGNMLSISRSRLTGIDRRYTELECKYAITSLCYCFVPIACIITCNLLVTGECPQL